jgi:hypothetical protein
VVAVKGGGGGGGITSYMEKLFAAAADDADGTVPEQEQQRTRSSRKVRCLWSTRGSERTSPWFTRTKGSMACEITQVKLRCFIQ